MSMLKHVHTDKLKIDKEFVAGIDCDIKSIEIVKALIKLGKVLEITVIAEGVENGLQFEFLKQSGCDVVQGFYLCESLSADELENRFFDVPQTHFRSVNAHSHSINAQNM